MTYHDQNLTIEGITYQSAVGYTPTAISTHDRGAINSVDIEGILAVAGVSRHDIAAGCFDHARMFVFEVNYQDLSQGILPLLRGFWGECQLHNNHYTTEFRSVSQALQQTVGEHYATHCRAQLGDARCRVDLVPLAIAGIVTEVESATVFMTAAGDHPDAYFQYGLLTWETGANAGICLEIQDAVRQANESLCLNLVEAVYKDDLLSSEADRRTFMGQLTQLVNEGRPLCAKESDYAIHHQQFNYYCTLSYFDRWDALAELSYGPARLVELVADTQDTAQRRDFFAHLEAILGKPANLPTQQAA